LLELPAELPPVPAVGVPVPPPDAGLPPVLPVGGPPPAPPLAPGFSFVDEQASASATLSIKPQRCNFVIVLWFGGLSLDSSRAKQVGVMPGSSPTDQIEGLELTSWQRIPPHGGRANVAFLKNGKFRGSNRAVRPPSSRRGPALYDRDWVLSICSGVS